MELPDLRQEYGRASLDERDVSPDPFVQFRAWFEQALARDLPEPNAMTLATASAENRPSARVVLLKGFDERGFVFYTNLQSRKGRELDANPFAALVFFYPTLERQIRVEGRVEAISPEESDAYYLSRPLGSRVGAWASRQSEVVADRATLDRRLSELETQAREAPLPRPPYWGGLRVVPEVFEFWQGRPNRMHDRLRYRREGESWIVERLEP
jgi:pyridoxamine 5'-phosphate oxidase